MILDLIKQNRTKRIYNGRPVPFNILRQFVESCLYSASTMNRQDIRYILVNDNKTCDDIFNITNLPTVHNISVENRPRAFIIMVVENQIKIPDSFLYYNLGIVTANLTLTALSKGYHSVTLLSSNMKKLSKIITLDKKMKAVSVIGVGKSDQKVRIEEIDSGDISYYKENETHVVPKLSIKTLILGEI